MLIFIDLDEFVVATECGWVTHNAARIVGNVLNEKICRKLHEGVGDKEN